MAVIDIGTNSTRLLVAEVAADGSWLRELFRGSRVTRLGRGVDTAGQLSTEAIEDVCAAISDYLEIVAEHAPEETSRSPPPRSGTRATATPSLPSCASGSRSAVA